MRTLTETFLFLGLLLSVSQTGYSQTIEDFSIKDSKSNPIPEKLFDTQTYLEATDEEYEIIFKVLNIKSPCIDLGQDIDITKKFYLIGDLYKGKVKFNYPTTKTYTFTLLSSDSVTIGSKEIYVVKKPTGLRLDVDYTNDKPSINLRKGIDRPIKLLGNNLDELDRTETPDYAFKQNGSDLFIVLKKPSSSLMTLTFKSKSPFLIDQNTKSTTVSSIQCEIAFDQDPLLYLFLSERDKAVDKAFVGDIVEFDVKDEHNQVASKIRPGQIYRIEDNVDKGKLVGEARQILLGTNAATVRFHFFSSTITETGYSINTLYIKDPTDVSKPIYRMLFRVLEYPTIDKMLILRRGEAFSDSKLYPGDKQVDVQLIGSKLNGYNVKFDSKDLTATSVQASNNVISFQLDVKNEINVTAIRVSLTCDQKDVLTNQVFQINENRKAKPLKDFLKLQGGIENAKILIARDKIDETELYGPQFVIIQASLVKSNGEIMFLGTKEFSIVPVSSVRAYKPSEFTKDAVTIDSILGEQRQEKTPDWGRLNVTIKHKSSMYNEFTTDLEFNLTNSKKSYVEPTVTVPPGLIVKRLCKPKKADFEKKWNTFPANVAAMVEFGCYTKTGDKSPIRFSVGFVGLDPAGLSKSETNVTRPFGAIILGSYAPNYVEKNVNFVISAGFGILNSGTLIFLLNPGIEVKL